MFVCLCLVLQPLRCSFSAAAYHLRSALRKNAAQLGPRMREALAAGEGRPLLFRSHLLQHWGGGAVELHVMEFRETDFWAMMARQDGGGDKVNIVQKAPPIVVETSCTLDTFAKASHFDVLLGVHKRGG